MSAHSRTELEGALAVCKGSFLSVGFFSFFVNLLMLVPSFYMLQVYDRAVGSASLSTLLMLTLIMLLLMITMGGWSGCVRESWCGSALAWTRC